MTVPAKTRIAKPPPSKPRLPMQAADLQGLSRLATDATVGIVDLVENLHHTIVRGAGIVAAPTRGPAPGLTGLVYRAVRSSTRLVGKGLDLGLGGVARRWPVGDRNPQREAALAALNGVFGDHLEASANPLAIDMRLRSDGVALDLSVDALAACFPQARGRVIVLIHGLCMNDLQWTREGHNHGQALARDLDASAVYLHYNSGRHISVNGRELAQQLESLLRHWPVPLTELLIVGHSMGGLVARSACHYAELEKLAWRRKLKRIVFLGTPHQGAPLERADSHVDRLLELSPYLAPFARLGKSRSAGIKDLRHGNVLDEDWSHPANSATRDHRHPLPLPAGVRCHAVAASLQEAPPKAGKHPRGDGLVLVASALGEHANPTFRLSFSADDSHVVYGCNHFDLLARDEVADRLLTWCGEVKNRVR